MLGRILAWPVLLGVICLSEPKLEAAQVLSIAHRGNSLFAPENTLAAFFAAQGKADLVETDGRLSADGVLVIMHDTTVDRTTDGTGTVGSQTVAQLKLLDAGSWFSSNFIGERIPTLAEMITNTVSFATPLIEQKDGPATAYVDELRRLNAVTNVILQSFDWNFLAAVHAFEPAVRLGALGSGTFTTAILTNIINSGATMVAWEKASVTPAVLSQVHGAGLLLFVWTVDSSAEIQQFINLGVDGIISNDPATVKGLQQPPATNAPAYLGDRLVAYWKMDDGLTNAFATTVADSKGNNAGTLVRNDGASHWFTEPLAKLDGCLKLEGLNAFVTMPQTADLDINTNQFTLSAWIRLQSLPAQLATSFGAIFDSTNDCYVLYLDKANNELRFKVTTANGHAARPGIPASFLQTNQWLHVVATFDGQAFPASGEAVIYLSGVEMDSHPGNDGGGGTGLTGNVKAGQFAGLGREGWVGANYFTGYVDDVAIWKRALTPTEVQQVFTAGQAGESLGDLLRLPTALIQFVSASKVGAGGGVEIVFTNLGPWSSFRLLRAAQIAGPYQAVEGVSAATLGGGQYRFNYTPTTSGAEYFRIEGR